jgi:amino acid adenylation domain-containing protein
MSGGLHRLVEAQADRDPEAVAIVQGERTLTYGELDRRANQLAQHLRQLGTGPEAIVGVSLERSPELIVAILAVLKAGGAYVPLDPRYPTDRLTYVIADAGVRTVICSNTESGARLASPIGIQNQPTFVRLDDPLLATRRTFRLQNNPNPRQLACVIYTSGSTGRPKGVQVEHCSLMDFTRSTVAEYGLHRRDRVLQFASISFDASSEEIYPALASGATLVLRTDACLASPRAFLDACHEWGITILDLPTAYWHELVNAIQRDGLRLPPGVRLAIIGGEAVRADRVAAWHANVDARLRLVNTYGPTEATVVATATTMDWSERGVPIGRPVHGACVHVLDQSLRPVPAGVDGELYVGGTGLARGYVGRPELTADRFIPDPFSRWPGRRLYRTGDLARWRDDGQLEFRGRMDRQVKLRGFRIELGEIEAALAQVPGVRDAVVLMREDTPGQQRLVAYVVADRRTVDASTLRGTVAETLPEFMVPGAFIFLTAMPLTPNGKLDQRALPAPERHHAATSSRRPMTELESAIAAVWADVLVLQHVDVEDNFFDLGGFSLKAFQVIGRVNESLGVDLPAHALFMAPTVEQLASVVAERQLAQADPDVLAALLEQLAVSC